MVVGDTVARSAQSPLYIMLLLCGANMTSWKHVQPVFFGVELTMRQPEQAACNERDDRHRAVVPNEKRVLAEGNEGLAESRRDGCHEEGECGDERTHILGRLREAVLERSDGGEDFGDGDQNVRTSLSPDINWGRAVIAGSVVAAGASLVTVICQYAVGECRDTGDSHVGLHDSSPDHSEASSEEASGDPLDGSESDTVLAKSGVDEDVHNGNDDDQGKRIQVGDDIVRNAME